MTLADSHFGEGGYFFQLYTPIKRGREGKKCERKSKKKDIKSKN
jgi:hypothetical protein